MELKVLALPFLLIVVVVWVTFDLRKHHSLVRQLEHELQAHLPVFSAETVHGKEAEFIRDRLSRKLPRVLLMLVALGALGALVWWLTP